jgi:signal transduction histidine kinase
MNRKLSIFSKRYQDALRTHLKQGRKANLKLAHGLGIQGLATGMQILNLAMLHEQTLIAEILPGCHGRQRATLIKQAGIFFAIAILPIEQTHRGAQQATAHLKKTIEALSQRTVELAASNLELSMEITQRKAVEAALKKSERHYSVLLEQSDRLQEQLRQLSRQILRAQEDERKEISRELHDVIAQTLTGINVRLAALKKQATTGTKGLDRNIAHTQKLVEQSVDIVHRFARDLRPAVLDDLGLIPALHSFMKNFTARTGVRTHLTAFAGVENLDTAGRTVLYRVAQEALTNVGRHAQANRVNVALQKIPKGISMKISDDGKSFGVEETLRANLGKHLGLLGMRERLEMVGGQFGIKSAPGEGTTIVAQIPFQKKRGGSLMESVKTKSESP